MTISHVIPVFLLVFALFKIGMQIRHWHSWSWVTIHDILALIYSYFTPTKRILLHRPHKTYKAYLFLQNQKRN